MGLGKGLQGGYNFGKMGQIKFLRYFFLSGLILSSLFFLSPQTQNERDMLEESNRIFFVGI